MLLILINCKYVYILVIVYNLVEAEIFYFPRHFDIHILCLFVFEINVHLHYFCLILFCIKYESINELWVGIMCDSDQFADKETYVMLFEGLGINFQYFVFDTFLSFLWRYFLCNVKVIDVITVYKVHFACCLFQNLPYRTRIISLILKWFLLLYNQITKRISNFAFCFFELSLSTFAGPLHHF